jgi:hypothetical protein
MIEATRLELGVFQGVRNLLAESRARATDLKEWSGRMDLNHQPPGPEPGDNTPKSLSVASLSATVRRQLSNWLVFKLRQQSEDGHTVWRAHVNLAVSNHRRDVFVIRELIA